MDIKWLEDFVVLAETRSFSRSALMRNITQPAFSRRIQALEAWLGVDLMVRTTYPPSLTPEGEAFYSQAKDLMGRIGALRTADLGQSADAQEAIRIALPHSLSLNFFSTWLTSLVPEMGPVSTQLRVGNVLDVVLWLVESGCDLMICYHHPQQPIHLDPERYDMLTLGVECVAPYSAPDGKGRPAFNLPGRSDQPVPFLNYSSSAYLGRMTELAITRGRARPHLRQICEADMADGLCKLALSGHGVAFLPDSVAADYAEARRLIRLTGGWEVEMQIRAYRERPTLARPARRRMELLWQLLESRHALHSPAFTPSPPSRALASPASPARKQPKKELP
jgi:LysR family transcriptional regulator, hypochlorite-specific transcription factor HypT